MSKSRRWILVVSVILVTLVALGLRLRAVALLPIDYDEDDYMRAGQHYAQAMRDGNWGELAWYDYNYEHPPLAKLAYGAALAFLPPAPEPAQRPTDAPPARSLPQPQFLVARLTSATWGVLTVLLLALVNPLAGLFLGLHTFTIKYTSQVMLEALPALTSLVAVVAYTRSKGRPSGWLALSAAALGLTVAAKYLYGVVGLAIAIHWLGHIAFQAPRPDVRAWPKHLVLVAGWGVLAVLVFALADPYLWPDPVGRLQASLSYNTAYAQSAHVQQAGFPVWQPLAWLFMSVPWHPGVFLVGLDGLIALLALLGLKPLWDRRPVYFLWLVVALGFLFLWPTKWPQYILVLTVPVSLAAAEGVRRWIWEPLAGLGRRFRAEEPPPETPTYRTKEETT